MHEITLKGQAAADNTLLLKAAVVLHEHQFRFTSLSWICRPGDRLATLVVSSSESGKKVKRVADRLAEIPGVYQVTNRGKDDLVGIAPHMGDGRSLRCDEKRPRAVTLNQKLHGTLRADPSGGGAQLVELAIALRAFFVFPWTLEWSIDPQTRMVSVALSGDGSSAVFECLARRIFIIDGTVETRASYYRPPERADVGFAVESSRDLAEWSSLGVVHKKIGDDGPSEIWQASLPAIGEPVVFFRLKVAGW